MGASSSTELLETRAQVIDDIRCHRRPEQRRRHHHDQQEDHRRNVRASANHVQHDGRHGRGYDEHRRGRQLPQAPHHDAAVDDQASQAHRQGPSATRPHLILVSGDVGDRQVARPTARRRPQHIGSTHRARQRLQHSSPPELHSRPTGPRRTDDLHGEARSFTGVLPELRPSGSECTRPPTASLLVRGLYVSRLSESN